MIETRMRSTAWAVAAALIVLPGEAAVAQDAAQGHDLARRWCTSCHLVEPGTSSAADTAPPFATIANDPKTTVEALHAWMVSPHPPMPNFNLSRQEEDDVVAYILSLKLR